MRTLLVAATVAALAAPEAHAAQPLVVHASFSPSAVLFGDTTTARIVVTSDGTAPVHVVYGIAPLTQLGRPTQRRAKRGALTVVTVELRAACLDAACVATSGRRSVAPAPVRVAAGSAHVTAAWSPLTVGGRVSESDVRATRLPFRADTSPPPVHYRVRPGLAAALLDAGGAILAIAGLLTAAGALLRARRRADDEGPDELARALRLARAAADRPAPDRRMAVGHIARLLARRDATLARRADDLAWSRPSPTPDALTELVDGVEGELPA